MKYKLHFQTGCRIDEKCISNLKVITKKILNNLLYKSSEDIFEGFHKNITLITTVQNTGEPSYLTKLLINTTPRLNLLKQDSRCRLPKHNSDNKTEYAIECDVGNPLETMNQQKVAIPFDLSQLDSNIDKIVIDLKLKTASEITKDSLMNETIVMDIIRNASLQMIG